VWRGGSSEKGKMESWKRRWELEIEEEVESGEGIWKEVEAEKDKKSQGVIRRRKIVENMLSWIRRMVGEAGRERVGEGE